MKDLKPTEPQYIEALAIREYQNESQSSITISCAEKRAEFIHIYQLALEHTGHEKLLEAAKDVINCHYSERGFAIVHLKKAIQQSEANKLNQ